MSLILTFVIIIGHLIEAGSGLQCYVCVEYSACQNEMYFDLKDDAVNSNCTPPFDKVCIVETYESLGGPVSHIRNCSDGVHFSFMAEAAAGKPRSYKRLAALKPNNETACVLDGTRQICLSFCKTNFCNGPQFKNIDHSGVMGTSQQFISQLFLVILVVGYNW